MKKVFLMLITGLFVLGAASVGIAAASEKGNMKGSGYEHKTDMPNDDAHSNLKVTKEDMQNAMKAYITENSVNGIFNMKDPGSGETRELSFIGLHEGLGAKDGNHFSCADFKDVNSGETLDVDIYVDVVGDDVKVSDVVIHKVDGKKVGGDESEMKGSGHEDKGSTKGSGY